MTRRKIIRAVTAAVSVRFHSWVGVAMRPRGYEAVSLSSPGPELEAYAGCGMEQVTIPMERRISPLRDLVSLYRLWRYMRRERPVMVHSMTPKAGLLCMMASRLAGVPVRVHTFTGLLFPTATGLRRRLLRLTDTLTAACATHVIPEGRGVMDDLRAAGITRKPMRVLGHGNVNGVDLAAFDPDLPALQAEAACLRRGECFTFLFVGRIAGDKGIDPLTEAFRALRREIPGVRLLIVGPDETVLDPVSPSAMEVLADGDGIELLGYRDDVRPLMLAADALVLPSYREGFPNVVLEAGAMRLPAVVTDINGSREIITHGVNGLIVPPRDSAALLDAMRRMTAMPADERLEMGRRARLNVAARFERGYVRRSLLDFYDSILPPAP